MGNPALEQAIREDRSDERRYLVYADWLAEKGEPLGELIHVQHALEARPGDGKLLKSASLLTRKLALAPDDLAVYGWNHGLLDWVWMRNDRDWMDSKFDALGLVARPVFSSPAAVVLRELRLGVLRWDRNIEDVPAIIREAAAHPFAPGLERLDIGVVENVDTAMYGCGDVGAAISGSFPGLRSLRIHSGSQSWGEVETFGVGGLALPELRTLHIHTCAMTKVRLAALSAGALPRLEELVLWFGSPSYDSDVTAADLQAWLATPPFPVRRLGLANFEQTDAIVGAIAGSPLAARLEHLDLSLGTLGPEGAAELAEQARRFPSLRTLDVRQSFLEEASIVALEAAFPSVLADDQRAPFDDGERYVAVHE